MEREGEGEWREVRRRGRGASSYSKTQRTGARFDNKVMENSVSFFFNNFPEGTWMETLENRFARVGKVLDIFCPRKRYLKGKPFGFVRFEGGADITRTLEELNNIWIGSYKMRAYVPKFERPRTEEQKKRTENRPEVQQSRFPVSKTDHNFARQAHLIPKGLRQSGKSFAEAIGGSAVPPADEIIGFQTTEEERTWLLKSFTGYVKSDFLWEDFEEEINSECASMLRISSLGGNLVIIQSIDHRPVQELLNGLDEWVSFWFEWVRPWSYVDVQTQRTVWTKWLGVPLQAWNSRFFHLACSKMGMVLKIHESTKERSRLDMALIQISTGLGPIDKTLQCNIDGARFKIRVVELQDQNALEIPCSQVAETESEDFSSSELEEEMEGSGSPAHAQVFHGGPVQSQDGGEIESTPVQPAIASFSVQNAADFPTPEKDCQQAVMEQSAGLRNQ
ncbi:uncharacterized protein LOC131009792 [Salvia miltiorrhiza]|uniref:uncharacterized protein LOC131009792 n=1 Tax=Salvia miltiorrhiza TaxID=226208 RepID=UPI0025ACFF4A|nr:uncharacterized protein LOC131009792 [Salvia miltiorrhiza]